MKIRILSVFFITIINVANAQNFQTVEEVDEVCSQLGFSSDEDAQLAVDRILNQIGIPSKGFALKNCPNINNAIAKNIKDVTGKYHRYILYDMKFMERISNQSNNDWSAISILAHEIGHHLIGHSLNNQGSNHTFELEADYWSGWALAKLGATLKESQSAINSLRYEKATSTHPAKSKRLNEIEKGWRKGQKNRSIVISKEPLQLIENEDLIVNYKIKKSTLEIEIISEESASIKIDVNQTNAIEELVDRSYSMFNDGRMCNSLLYSTSSSTACNEFESKATTRWEGDSVIYEIPFEEITTNNEIHFTILLWNGERRKHLPFNELIDNNTIFTNFETTYVIYRDGRNPVTASANSKNSFYIKKEKDHRELLNLARMGDLKAILRLGDKYYKKAIREKNVVLKNRWKNQALFYYKKVADSNNKKVAENINALNKM